MWLNSKPNVALLCVQTHDQMVQSNVLPRIPVGCAISGNSLSILYPPKVHRYFEARLEETVILILVMIGIRSKQAMEILSFRSICRHGTHSHFQQY